MTIFPDVLHNVDEGRFEIQLDDGSVAFLSYRLDEATAAYEHTWVPGPFEGRGLAAELTRVALVEARQRGWKVVPVCRYVDVFIRRHPEFSDLLE